MKYFIYNFTFIPHGLLRTDNPQMSSSQHRWVHSSVRWIANRYHKVTGLNPLEIPTFSGFYIRNCMNQSSVISGFIAQLAGASHWYSEVTRLNPFEVPTFSGFYIRNCINCFHNCEDHSLLEFTSTVQYMKYLIHNFTFTPHGLLRTHNPQMTSSQYQWLHSSVGSSIAPVSRSHTFKPP